MVLRLRTASIVLGGVILPGLLGVMPAGCSSESRGTFGDPRPAPFQPVDAASDVSEETLMCATAECPAGTTTCATSRARCDVDLTSDRDNCGECGAACPPDQHRDPWDWGTGPNLEVAFACVDSRCVMRCQDGFADCDGIPDNGCEVDLTSPTNCGACGVACAPGQPCADGKCGCEPPKVACDGFCVDTRNDVAHCGACHQSCGGGSGEPGEPPTPPGPIGPIVPPPGVGGPELAPASQNTQMDCINAECKLACRPPFADCNGDPDDGCEKDLSVPDDQNCGACGAACPSGTACDAFEIIQESTGRLRCGCPPGLQRCPLANGLHSCIDTLTDPTNCGGCGIVCTYDDRAHSRPVCRGGICGLTCRTGRGDCNGFSGDGCEIDLETDPRNCGACEHECDAEIGQPCVKGRCAETECSGGVR